MEKSVGANLHHIEHSIARSYTIRDTLTKYIIRTTIGKREILLEECNNPTPTASPDCNNSKVQSSGTYRLSVYEDGQEIGRHEANINVPENMVNVLNFIKIIIKFILINITNFYNLQLTILYFIH